MSTSNPNSLPGIVVDQPEVYESEPILDEVGDPAGIKELDLINEPPDPAIDLIEVPVKQAFSYFAERENEIARFYVQRYGEYKLSGTGRSEEESEIEKYHRLVSEVNGLLAKFQDDKTARANSKALVFGSIDSEHLTNNLEVLARQLNTLESAAKDGNLDPTRANYQDLISKLDKLGQESATDQTSDNLAARDPNAEAVARNVRLSALERRLNVLETILGHNEEKAQSVLKLTNCDSLSDAAETLSSWLALFKPDATQRINREIDYIAQRLEKIGESGIQRDKHNEAKINQLWGLVTATDKYRAMVPTIVHRLNAMEELQQRAVQVARTVNHLEQVQAQIVDSLQSNRSSVASLNEMFRKNMDSIKEFSNDIDQRIRALRQE